MAQGATRTALCGTSVAAAALVLLAAVAAGGPEASAATLDITASNFRFSPNDSAATVGDEVRFSNGGGTHTAVTVGGVYPVISLGAGLAGSWQLTSPGTVWYYCGIHSNSGAANEAGLTSGAMVGRIIVVPGAAPTPPTEPTSAAASPTATTAAPTPTLMGAATANATPIPTATPSATPVGGTATSAPTSSDQATATATPSPSAAGSPPAKESPAPLPPKASGDGESPALAFAAGGLALAAVAGGVGVALWFRRRA